MGVDTPSAETGWVAGGEGSGALLCLCEAGGAPSTWMYQAMMKHAWGSRKR